MSKAGGWFKVIQLVEVELYAFILTSSCLLREPLLSTYYMSALCQVLVL